MIFFAFSSGDKRLSSVTAGALSDDKRLSSVTAGALSGDKRPSSVTAGALSDDKRPSSATADALSDDKRQPTSTICLPFRPSCPTYVVYIIEKADTNACPFLFWLLFMPYYNAFPFVLTAAVVRVVHQTGVSYVFL